MHNLMMSKYSYGCFRFVDTHMSIENCWYLATNYNPFYQVQMSKNEQQMGHILWSMHTKHIIKLKSKGIAHMKLSYLPDKL